jgi:transposase
MYYAGIDAHLKSSTIYVMDEKGQKVKSSTVVTSREGLRTGLGGFARGRLVAAVGSSGIALWVVGMLKELGAEVVVVNPNRVRLIAESRKKTDRVDARLLAELLRLGAAPAVHVPSEEARKGRAQLSVRRQLVRQRTALVNQARGLLRGWGVSLEARGLGTLEGWKRALRRRELPLYVKELLAVLGGVFEQLSEALEGMKARLKQEAKCDERVERLQTIPGVGMVSALTLVAAVDEVERFQSAKQMTGYFGIVPSVRASGEREEQGRITRQGRSEVRAVWIQAAHALARSRQPAAQPLQRWFHRVAYRRGLRTALVALARRMLSLAFYLLRDGTPYEPRRLRWAVA